MASHDLEKVTFPSLNALGDGEGYLVGDRSCKEGLIVVHEWWGVTDQMKRNGQKLSQQGLLVLVPDMYRGQVAKNFEEAGHLMGDLDWIGACKDVSGAAQYLKSLGCGKVGITGYCMGGALAFAAAANCPEISAASGYYGIPKPQYADLTSIKVPLQGHFGDQDDVAGFSSPADYEPLEVKLREAGVDLDWNVYHGALHAFANETGPNYHAEACKLSTERLIAFMHKYLG